MDFADSGAQPNEQHAMSEHKTIFAYAGVERASVMRDQGHLRGEAKRRSQAPLMFDLTDDPACAGRGPLPPPQGGWCPGLPRPGHPSQGERFADRARYGVLYYCALNTATHPCTQAGVPAGGAV
jgi:hypothetical protein